jgi:3-hydroxyisobutyrate dehydrogenase
VLSCLADAAALEAALFADNGVATSAGARSQFVDFSTIGPRPTMELAKRLRTRCGSSWVDAPVSGGVVGAEQGKLVIFCGGAPADVDRLEPIFSILSQRWTRVGDLGAGQTLKLCNQLIVSSNLIAIAEALTLARAGGLDPKMVPDALTGGFADSLPMQIFGRRMAEGITLPMLGELGLMLKDLSAIDELARLEQCRLPLMSSAMQIYRQAAERGLARKDLATLVSLYQSE